MYRKGLVSKTGTRLSWPISVADRGQKPRCIRLYRTVARNGRGIPLSVVCALFLLLQCYYKNKNTLHPAVRSKILSKRIFAASCVWYSDRAYYWVRVLIKFFFFTHSYFSASGQQAVVTGVAPSPPRFLPSIFIAHIGFSNPTARRFFVECWIQIGDSPWNYSVACTRVNKVMLINRCAETIKPVFEVLRGAKFDSCVWKKMRQFIKSISCKERAEF